MNAFSRHRKTFTIAALGALLVCLIFVWFPLVQSFFASPQATDNKGAQEPVLILEKPKPLSEYVTVVGSCGPYHNGVCVNVRTGPGTDFPKIAELRNGMVLKVEKSVFRNLRLWYKISLDRTIRYPERIAGDWYVAADFTEHFFNEGDIIERPTATSTKQIIVDLSDQKLYAYDGDSLFTEETVSTGLLLTPTPRGKFFIFKKTPSRYMQGPLVGVSDQYYDLPGVPWNLYFTHEGAVIHGAYWHDKFGQLWSHGCVNLSPEKAKKLYLWAEVGTPVIVRN